MQTKRTSDDSQRDPKRDAVHHCPFAWSVSGPKKNVVLFSLHRKDASLGFRSISTTHVMLSTSGTMRGHCSQRSATARTFVSARQASVRTRALVRATTSVASTSKPNSISAAEKDVLLAISNVKGRGKDGMDEASTALLTKAVATLEASNAGVPDPTNSELLEGKWKLLYTTRPSSASPIQRSFVGVDGFSVFQEVTLRNMPRVNNVVEFGPIGFLKVEAAASTDQQPLANFTPRKGKGFFIFGASSSAPPARANVRLDFQFETAAFNLRFLPQGVTIPYPVPFRLLGDERKGWLDVTYLSKDGGFRLSRGNKGTLFVLKKEDGAKELLLRVLGDSKNRRNAKNQIDVQDLVDRVVEEEAGVQEPAKSKAARGGWKVRRFGALTHSYALVRTRTHSYVGYIIRPHALARPDTLEAPVERAGFHGQSPPAAAGQRGEQLANHLPGRHTPAKSRPTASRRPGDRRGDRRGRLCNPHPRRHHRGALRARAVQVQSQYKHGRGRLRRLALLGRLDPNHPRKQGFTVCSRP